MVFSDLSCSNYVGGPVRGSVWLDASKVALSFYASNGGFVRMFYRTRLDSEKVHKLTE